MDWRTSVPVPIIHRCWSGCVLVLVEGAGEPVPSPDIQARDPLGIGLCPAELRAQALTWLFAVAKPLCGLAAVGDLIVLRSRASRA